MPFAALMSASVLCIALALVSCGGSQPAGVAADRERIADALDDARASVASGSAERVCAELGAGARDQLSRVGHTETCLEGANMLLKGLKAGRKGARMPDAEVSKVKVPGSDTVATVDMDGESSRLPFVEEDGRWRLDSFYGLNPRPSRLYRPALRGVAEAVLFGAPIAPATPAAGQDGSASSTGAHVEQTGRDGRPRDCPSIDSDVRPIAGGCVAKISDTMTVAILTPFARMPFATCQMSLTARFEADGKVAFDSIEIEDIGKSQRYPCPDIRSCSPASDLPPKPWLGEVRSRGSDFEIALDVCFDTCAGWFEGPLVLSLDRTGAGWRMVTDRAKVGETGLEMSGALRLDGVDLRFKRRTD